MTNLYHSKIHKLCGSDSDHLRTIYFRYKVCKSNMKKMLILLMVYKVALAFIHSDNVINAFTDLSIHLDDTFQTMLDYFEDNYIGRFRANGTYTTTIGY